MGKMAGIPTGTGIMYSSSTARMGADELCRVRLIRRAKVRITRKGIIGRGKGRRKAVPVLLPLAHRASRMVPMGLWRGGDSRMVLTDLRRGADSSNKDRGRTAKEEEAGMGRKSMALGVSSRCLHLL
jgi:hypothetical protein